MNMTRIYVVGMAGLAMSVIALIAIGLTVI